MCGRRLLFVKLMLILIGKSSTSHCDMATTAIVPEGVLGQTPDFNWLGVLRVHLHDGDSLQIAVSGIVLIKDKYALANADDVARIPQRIFQSDTLAMFIPTGDTPWYVAPLSYVTHPEYEYTTLNTIAVIELNFSEDQDSPLVPICFPTFTYNASSYLYITGYTDEDKLLEKVIYKIQYLERHVCEEFYNRAGLSDKNRVPTAYLCGYAPHNSSQCVWDNGMVLVSNATGWFTLIGFGVRGPGCAAPARFIDIAPYISWINSVTNSEEIYDSVDYRRQEEEDEFVPAHKLFTSNTTRRQYQLPTGSVITRDYITYPFNTEKLRHFTIESEDENTILIYPFNTTMEGFKGACAGRKALLYREIFELKGTADTHGATTYKLSLYDLMYKICTCVEMQIECTHREGSVLAFKDTIDFNLGTQLGESGETPEELFRYYPITERTVAPPTGSTGLDPWKNSNLRPKYLTQKIKSGSVINYDLYIKYYFSGNAKVTFALYSNLPKETVQPSAARRAKVKVPHIHKPYWGMKETVGRRVKPEETFVAVEEHEEVQATVNDAWCCVPAPIVLALGYICIRYLL